MPDVFISYSRKDGEFSRKLHQKFSELGKDVWMDWEDIPLSADWWEEIRKGIETSDNFILIMSPDSIGSPICQLEIDHALKFHKRIIPVFHRDPTFDTALDGIVERVHIDKHLSKMTEQFNILELYGTNRETLAKLNWVFFKSDDVFDEKFPTLLKTVDEDLAHIRQHTRLLTRALEWDNNARNVSFSISGDELDTAEAWLAGAAHKQPAPVELHRIYLTASRHIENNRTRLLRGLQVASGVFGVLVIVALIGIAISINRANYAQEQAATATVAQGEALIQQGAAQEQAALAQTERAVAIDYAATATVAQGEALNQQATAQQAAAIAVTAQQGAENRANTSGTQVADARIEANGYSTQVAIIGATLTPVPPTLTAVALDVKQQQLRAELLRLSGEANDLLIRSDSNPELAALLALRSLKLGYTETADKALTRSTRELYTTRIFSEDDTSQEVYASEFSPDDIHAAIGGESGNVVIWEYLTGKKVHTFALNTAVDTLAYSSDGRQLAAGLQDGTFVVLDPDTGQELWRLARPDKDQAWGVAFSPAGHWLVLSWLSGEVMLANWQTNELREISSSENALSYTTFTAAFSPDGRYIAANDDVWLNIWDAQTGEQVQHIKTVGGIYDVQFSPDSATLVTGHTNAAVQQYNVATGELMRDYYGHTGLVNAVDFRGDGRMLATAGEDGTIVLWDTDTGESFATLRGHTAAVYWVDIAPDGNYILSASLDGTARLWSFEAVLYDGAANRFLLDTNQIFAVAYSPDGQYIATGSSDPHVRIWDTKTGEMVAELAHNKEVEAVVFSPDGTLLATTGFDEAVYLWSVPDFEFIAELDLPEAESNEIAAFAFSPDGKRGVGGSANNKAYVWDITTGEILLTFEQHTNWVLGAEWSPDGQSIATSGADNMVYIWDANTGEMRQSLEGHKNHVTDVAWSPDGRYLASSSRDNTIFIWDAATGAMLHMLNGHTFWVSRVAWSSDGKHLVSTSYDQTARVWDTTTWQTTRIYRGHNGLVYDAAFSPDGKQIVTGSGDATALVWDTDYHDLLAYACSRLPRDLTPDERTTYGLDAAPTCP